MNPGSTLMMFTDGLVERRGQSIDDGIARVADIMTQQSNSPVDVVAEVVLRELAPPGGYDDDVAVVVCRPPVTPLRIDDAAAPTRLAPIRRRLNAWLRLAAVPRGLAASIILATGEACANSIEHAYRGRPPGTLHVHADLDDDEIRVTIVDHGSWAPPSAEPCTRGRGLPLIEALSDEAHVSPTAEGTTVTMTFSLSPQR
jgi:anti-sigma regulatory factor (Ser/Thr protein kinase)